MNFLIDMHNKKLAENDNNLRFWEDYLHNLKSLDFSIYSDKLKVPTLVPIGNRIFFRGDIKHTNEVTVSLGADYFAKCSLKQAEVLRQHRIKGAESKVAIYRNEREFLENQMFGKNNAYYEDAGQEIVEVFTEEEERIWKEKHRENVKKYKQGIKSNEEKQENIADEELWERLDELELREELENELAKFDKKSSHNLSTIEINDVSQRKELSEETKVESKATYDSHKELENSKTELLQRVLDKQNELEHKLQEMKCRDRIQPKTESDLLSRLQEMEELDELEDEMDRLDDILETEDVEENENANEATPVSELKRSVSFADEDDSETLELTFQHSNVEPSKEPYDKTKGITKPSDIYKAFPNLFGGATSILKKSKYNSGRNESLDKKVNYYLEDTIIEENSSVERAIVVKDIVEREVYGNNQPIDNKARPTSLFKMRRQQRK